MSTTIGRASALVRSAIERGIAVTVGEVREAGVVGRPGRRGGALAQERPRRASGQRDEPLWRARSRPPSVNQISAPSPEKPKVLRMSRERSAAGCPG